MRGFFGFSAVYLAIAILLVELVRGDGVISAMTSISGTLLLLPGGYQIGVAALAFGAGAVGLCRFWGLAHIVARVAFAVLGTGCFLSAFALIKTLLPDIQPFYADRWLADFDQWIHGGIDPWRLTHAWSAYLPMGWIEPLYIAVWGIPAMLLPVLLAVQDPDEARVRRFLILYGIAWIGLGNVTALAGMSAGPVYFDRLLGEARFAELNAAIDGGFLISAAFPYFQEELWQLYIDGYQIVGSGISAFPSVHVAMACVVALYLCERARVLIPVAAAFLTAILFLSVYTGYHYAIDGYASIAVIAAAWALLRRPVRREIPALGGVSLPDAVR